MILVTHATHFLSTRLMRTLNQHNFNYLVAVDDFPRCPFPSATLHIQQLLKYHRLMAWLDENVHEVECMFQLDARDDEPSDVLFQRLWQRGVNHQVPFIFRTSPARTAWIEQQPSAPFFWAGLSFADAFGPGDEGWVAQAYQSLTDGLPASDHSSEARAMVYSPDIAAVGYFLMHHRTHSGVYSLGNETTVTYEQVVDWVKKAAIGSSTDAPMIEAPASLQTLGFDQSLFSPEAGVYEYVQNHWRGSAGY